jgi:hypothetical protein
MQLSSCRPIVAVAAVADSLAPRPLPRIEVDAATVAHALDLKLEVFKELMDTGRIRTLSERGVGDDLGRYRLSFWFGKRRFRMITDADGRLIARDPG